MRVEFGKTYTDKITGFVGVATSRTEYITGCVHVGLQPKWEEGKPLAQPEYFDENRLIDSREKGGPAHHPPHAGVHR